MDASQEKDNNKTESGKERKFKLHEEEPIRIEEKKCLSSLSICRKKKNRTIIIKKTLEVLNAEFSNKLKDFPMLFVPVPTAKNPKRTLLEKNIYAYTARFNF